MPWNRVGQTHFSLNVRNTQKWHDYLVSKGVRDRDQARERSPRGHTFFFARDCDGNLIELMDLGYMHYVLNWLGPLGGWLFRRGHVQAVLPASLTTAAPQNPARRTAEAQNAQKTIRIESWCRSAIRDY